MNLPERFHHCLITIIEKGLRPIVTNALGRGGAYHPACAQLNRPTIHLGETLVHVPTVATPPYMRRDLQALEAVELPEIRQPRLRTSESVGRSSGYPAACCRHRLIEMRRALCSFIYTVTPRSERLSMIALIAALVAAASSTLIVQATQPAACVMTHHECDHTARITDCCCLANDASPQGGPIESRVQLAVDLSPHPVALPAGAFADTSGSSLHVHIPPPSASPSDFTTRSAPLLI